MFNHRKISSPTIEGELSKVEKTISKDMARKAAGVIGCYVAEDMPEFAGLNKSDIDRVYVKWRDGPSMAVGIKKALPHVDIRYIKSREKQHGLAEPVPISFWDPWDGYSNDIAWFADPINATGDTAMKSMRFLHKHFRFDTMLFSHVAANKVGISKTQTELTDLNIDAYMNYAFLSTKLDPKTGYMLDFLELIPDFGDKVWGTLGEDYPVRQIQEDIKRLLGTGVGDVEIIKGALLYLLQLINGSEYRGDRGVSWATEEWITYTLMWYKVIRGLHFKLDREEQIIILLDDLVERGFLKPEDRPWKKGFVKIYSLTEEGLQFTSSIYLPILKEQRIAGRLQKDIKFLAYLDWKQIYNRLRYEA